jgi:hydrogenase maturation protease
VKVLVAGVGNVFLGDDAFGVEVARRLASGDGAPLPEGTSVVDYGIRGVHLALDLLSPPDLLVLVDCITKAGRPGTLYMLDPELSGELPRVQRTRDDLPKVCQPASSGDPHAMDPYTVLLTVRRMGGVLPRTRIIGCEPAHVGERMGLSEPVRQAIEPAIAMIRRLLDSEVRNDEKPLCDTEI